MKTKKSILFLEYMILSIIGLIMLWPFVQMLSTSFMNLEDAISRPPKIFPEKLRISGYQRVFDNLPMLTLYLNSIIVLFFRVLGHLFTSSFSGYAFAKYEFFGKKFFFGIVLAIMMVPGQIFILPQYLMMSDMKLLNTLTAVILPNTLSAYGIFLMRQFFLTIPNELIESSRMDGAGHLRIFFQIVAPLAKPGLIVYGLMAALWSWNDLLWPLIVNKEITKLTLPVSMLYLETRYLNDFPSMMAAATITILPMMIIYMLVQKNFKNISLNSGMK